MNDPDLRLLLIIVLAAIAAGAAWYFRDEILPTTAPATTATEQIVPPKETPAAPRHPIEELTVSGASDVNLVPLPGLDESDEYFLLAMAQLLGPEIERLLVNEALIDKFVATVDNLPRRHVAENIRPVGQLAGVFSVIASPEDGIYYQNPDNFDRYDPLVGLIANADVEGVVAMYRRFYPLLQEAYVRLGYPDGYFNDRLIEVVDHLLGTPEPEEPIPLVQPHVLFEFADPDLEALSSGQRLLLRISNKHATTLKAVLLRLRTRLVQE